MGRVVRSSSLLGGSDLIRIWVLFLLCFSFGTVNGEGGSTSEQGCSGLTPHAVDSGPSALRFMEFVIGADQECKIVRLYAFTYSTKLDHPEFCLTLASAAANSFRMNVLGSSRNESFSANGPLDKVWALRDAMTRVPDDENTLVLFVDSFDVLFNGSPTALVKRFMKVKAGVLWSTEKGCCSTRDNMARRDSACDPDWPAPPVDTHTPFLNSGAFMGFQKAIRDMLQSAEEEYMRTRKRFVEQQGLVDPYRSGTDQLLFCHLFAHSEEFKAQVKQDKRRKMTLDYHSKIFKCMYKLDANELLYTSKGRAVSTNQVLCHHHQGHPRNDWLEACQRYRAKPQENTYPVVLHFNGPPSEKETRNLVAQRILWPSDVTQADVWNETILDVDKVKVRKLSKICSEHTPRLACANTVGECMARQERPPTE